MLLEPTPVLFEFGVQVVVTGRQGCARWAQIQHYALRVFQVGFLAEGHGAGDAQLVAAAQVPREVHLRRLALGGQRGGEALQLGVEVPVAALAGLPVLEARHGRAPELAQLGLVGVAGGLRLQLLQKADLILQGLIHQLDEAPPARVLGRDHDGLVCEPLPVHVLVEVVLGRHLHVVADADQALAVCLEGPGSGAAVAELLQRHGGQAPVPRTLPSLAQVA
mmetsp:Transcript_56687/g.165879  ORF Transcript_56687/g.165879 Transcript_56687/m.165879 type:complete len:221 (-) Transcript_56687:3-665(-)